MRRALRQAAWIAVIAPAGCVTTDLEYEAGPIAASSIVIPLSSRGGGGGDRDPLAEYYTSVMFQLQDAVLERHPERIRALCDQHDRAAAPAWARTQVARYRATAAVIEAENFLERNSKIELRGDATPPLGARVPFVFRAPVGETAPVKLSAGDNATSTRFLVQLDIHDYDCLGGTVQRSFSQILRLPMATTIGQVELELPFDLDALAPEGVWRGVSVAVTLLPGNVTLGREPMPNRRIVCARRELELYPVGADTIRGEPLRTLRNALRSGETQHLDHVYLAARFMPESERLTATALLVDRVRLGDSVQARACMAALAATTGVAISVDDREGWLRWWSDTQGSGQDAK